MDIKSTHDILSIKGRVQKILRDENGSIVQLHDDHNLVVNIGIEKLLKLIMGSYTGTVAKCSVGSGGAPSDNAFAPISPTVSDTGLTTFVMSKLIGTSVLNGASPSTSATFTTLFTSVEANCLANEVALLFADNSIFAKHTFPTMYLKNDRGYSLEVIWTIQITSIVS